MQAFLGASTDSEKAEWIDAEDGFLPQHLHLNGNDALSLTHNSWVLRAVDFNFLGNRGVARENRLASYFLSPHKRI